MPTVRVCVDFDASLLTDMEQQSAWLWLNTGNARGAAVCLLLQASLPLIYKLLHNKFQLQRKMPYASGASFKVCSNVALYVALCDSVHSPHNLCALLSKAVMSSLCSAVEPTAC